MNSATDREVIHLSVGSKACEITAHWSNLQGLAGTFSPHQKKAPPCSPEVTHSTYQQRYYVPRALLIDRPAAFVRQQQRLFGDDQQQLQEARDGVLWSGTVEVFNPTSSSTTTTGPSQGPTPDPLSQFFQDASALAYASHSRYKISNQQQQQTISFNSNGRHVDWDQEEEEDDDLEERERVERLRQRQEEEWYRSTYAPLQTQLDDFWNDDSQQQQVAAPPTQDEESSQPVVTPQYAAVNTAWIDFWMPPYHPKSCLSLPQDSTVTRDWDESFNRGWAGISNSWREEELSERLRSILEECDACQGVVLASSAQGWSAGLSCVLLQELQDECPAAQRMVISIENTASDHEQQQQQQQKESVSDSSENQSWHTANVHRVRGPIEQGLALHQFTELAHAVLPLSSWSHEHSTHTPARIAAALESLTLPYRLSGQQESLVGLNSSHFYGSMSDSFPFGTASKLTFREYLGQLRPSSKHIMLELDMMLPETSSTVALDSRLLEGTSVERDRRMQQRNSSKKSHQDELPGSWMSQAARDTGVMTCMSPVAAVQDRSQHFHFSVSTALRPTGSLSLEEYMTCLMEGTGPRFRPQQATATVVRQSLEDLTTGGYGAGSYWKSVWKNRQQDRGNPPRGTPVLAVLGNTTRRYAHLDQLAMGMKQALSPKLRGFFNRDVMQGALPEVQDCEESLATCWDLRDTYMPPSGSGFGEDTSLKDF